jgi:hypothetical protein
MLDAPGNVALAQEVEKESGGGRGGGEVNYF